MKLDQEDVAAVAAAVLEALGAQPDDRPPLTVAEAGKRLGVSERAVRTLVNGVNGKPPKLASILVGDGARRVEQAELDRYKASLRSAG